CGVEILFEATKCHDLMSEYELMVIHDRFRASHGHSFRYEIEKEKEKKKEMERKEKNKQLLKEAYTEMIAERRKKVNSGSEDTFGFRNNS
ncbi:hypothetical protein Tco_1489980, partial [Tanacetum coccineum]